MMLCQNLALNENKKWLLYITKLESSSLLYTPYYDVNEAINILKKGLEIVWTTVQ